ncbi:MAG TPA: RNA-binding cell elongation regulator Jag/EloR [Clostridia bacterium]|nr:RNA-binding cell elongation regulator Jag/EloR [Clostridia bacterium]
MNKTIEIKATTVELAIEEGLLELGAKIEEVEVEILSKGGLFQKAVIKMSTIESMAEKAEKFVGGVLKYMNLDADAKAVEDKDSITINIAGKDSGAIIGYRGEALDAIQYLTLTVLNHDDKDRYKKVVVNSENYREKREETLIGLANRLAEKAYQYCKKVVLEPMNPYERRIIHSSLQNSEIAETTSEGEEPNRHVVIIPKGVEIVGTYEANRENNRTRRDNPRGNDSRRDDRQGERRPRSNRPYDSSRQSDRPYDASRQRSDRAPQDSYDDYDKIESKPQILSEELDFAPLEPVKKEGAPKFKSFGGKKRFPF